MDFNEYQKAALEMAVYHDKGHNLIYPALGLAGESGEVVDKIKKLWRNYNITGLTDFTVSRNSDHDGLVKELGDVLWYIAALAYELNVPLEKVATINIDKLRDRAARNVVKSEGDNR